MLLAIIHRSASRGFAELRSNNSFVTWTLGWLVRVLCQVTFFAMVGQLAGSARAVQYIAVGNACAIITVEASAMIRSMCAERQVGTLGLLIATPTGQLPVFFGRGLQWLCTGLVSSSAALVLVPRLLGAAVPVSRLLESIPQLAVVGASFYCLACTVGGLALRRLRWQWLVINLTYLVPMTFCGVDVPVTFWPWPIHALAEVIPLTHGLESIRATIQGAPISSIAVQILLTVATGLGWLGVAAVSFNRLVSSGRRDGTIELG